MNKWAVKFHHKGDSDNESILFESDKKSECTSELNRLIYNYQTQGLVPKKDKHINNRFNMYTLTKNTYLLSLYVERF